MNEKFEEEFHEESVVIDRPDRLADLETSSPKSKVVLIGFTMFVLLILTGLFYVQVNRPKQQQNKKAPAKRLASDPGKINTSLPKFDSTLPKKNANVVIPEEVTPDSDIIIPGEVPLRPDTVTLDDLVTKEHVAVPDVPKIDPSFLRKGGGSILSGSTTTKTEKKTATKSSVLTSKAKHLKNLNYLILQGTKIACTMENALDSTIAGNTSCIVSNDVFSANGNVILLERGTKVSGKYESSLQQGQARLYVNWGRAVTPKGVTIELNSGSAGDLGEAGIGGYVNKHWWERFGNALLVSIVADTLGYISDSTNNENFENTEDTVNEMATIAAEAGITIQPTLNVNQGASIIIYAQRDLDFSNIYQLTYDKDR